MSHVFSPRQRRGKANTATREAASRVMAVRWWRFLVTASALALLAVATARVISARASDESTTPTAPERLSETGLYVDTGSLTVDPRNRSFAPQYPLWSDGAIKRRWVRLPEGGTIDVTNLDHWDFPVGTKFWKEFSVRGSAGRNAIPVESDARAVGVCVVRVERRRA